jgi:hypothetical protein
VPLPDPHPGPVRPLPSTARRPHACRDSHADCSHTGGVLCMGGRVPQARTVISSRWARSPHLRRWMSQPRQLRGTGDHGACHGGCPVEGAASCSLREGLAVSGPSFFHNQGTRWSDARCGGPRPHESPHQGQHHRRGGAQRILPRESSHPNEPTARGSAEPGTSREPLGRLAGGARILNPTTRSGSWRWRLVAPAAGALA